MATAEEMENLKAATAAFRKEVENNLPTAIDYSNKSGKLLLILVGESHVSISSRIKELIILDVAHDLGIHDMAVEFTFKHRDGARMNEQERAAELKSRMQMDRGSEGGFDYALAYAEYRGDMTVHAIDGKHHKARDSKGEFRDLSARDMSMALNIKNISKPLVVIVGALHMSGIETLVENTGSHYIDPFLSYLDARGDLHIEWNRLNSDKIIPNPQHLTAEEAITVALGDEAPTFLQFAKGKGYLESQESLAAREAKALETLQKNPSDLIAARELGQIYVRQGRWDDAAYAYAETIDLAIEFLGEPPSAPNNGIYFEGNLPSEMQTALDQYRVAPRDNVPTKFHVEHFTQAHTPIPQTSGSVQPSKNSVKAPPD